MVNDFQTFKLTEEEEIFESYCADQINELFKNILRSQLIEPNSKFNIFIPSLITHISKLLFCFAPDYEGYTNNFDAMVKGIEVARIGEDMASYYEARD